MPNIPSSKFHSFTRRTDMSPANGHADSAESRRDVGAAQLVATFGAGTVDSGTIRVEANQRPCCGTRAPLRSGDYRMARSPIRQRTENFADRLFRMPTQEPIQTASMRCSLLRAGRENTRSRRVRTSSAAKTKKTVAKVFVTCELTIFGLGTHSATGEE